MRKTISLLLVCGSSLAAFAACSPGSSSRTVLFDDGGAGEASAEPDAPAAEPTPDQGGARLPKQPKSSGCLAIGGRLDQREDGCTNEDTYQCETDAGFDAFRVACSCPSATCGCYVNGTLTKHVAFNGCPSCTSPVALAKLCGFAVDD
jgi:hypothetical protein